MAEVLCDLLYAGLQGVQPVARLFEVVECFLLLGPLIVGDKLILDALVEAPEVARANRDYLRGLYGVIKDCDAHVRFTFLTGISKFSKVNLFSQLNNLTDPTLHRRYSSICGYTEADLDTVFAPELEGLDRAQMREWYNGYRWRGEARVYNPYDVLLYFTTARCTRRGFRWSLTATRGSSSCARMASRCRRCHRRAAALDVLWEPPVAAARGGAP